MAQRPYQQGFPQAGDSLLSSALKRKNNATLFDRLTHEIWGERTTWIVEDAPPSAAPDHDPRSTRQKAVAEAGGDPMVQAVLEVFGGNIQSVQNQGNRETTS